MKDSHRRTWQTIASSFLTSVRADSAHPIQWRVLFDAHGTLTAIGVLLLPEHLSRIPCRPNCDNAILSDNSNGV